MTRKIGMLNSLGGISERRVTDCSDAQHMPAPQPTCSGVMRLIISEAILIISGFIMLTGASEAGSSSERSLGAGGSGSRSGRWEC